MLVLLLTEVQQGMKCREHFPSLPTTLLWRTSLSLSPGGDQERGVQPPWQVLPQVQGGAPSMSSVFKGTVAALGQSIHHTQHIPLSLQGCRRGMVIRQGDNKC